MTFVFHEGHSAAARSPHVSMSDIRAHAWWRPLMWMSMSAMIAVIAWGSVAMAAGDDAVMQTQGAALARAKNCLACHQVDSRRVGPPLASVAKRYGPSGDVADYLALTIRQGGRGRWGAVPMPAQPQVSESDARELAAWILSLSPADTAHRAP